MLMPWLMTLTVVLGLTVAGDEATTEPAADKPKSVAAINALNRHDIIVKRAQLECQRAIAAADKQLIADLDDALKIAMKAGNFDEAKRIDEAKKDAELSRQEMADRLKPPAPRSRTFSIDAAKGWQPTLEVKKGQKLKIISKGQWCWSTKLRSTAVVTADGDKDPKTKAPIHYLEGRVNKGTAFGIGSNFDMVVTADGPLELEMADPSRDDNEGVLTVTITGAEVNVAAMEGAKH